jgi:hypothetical protein
MRAQLSSLPQRFSLHSFYCLQSREPTDPIRLETLAPFLFDAEHFDILLFSRMMEDSHRAAIVAQQTAKVYSSCAM